MTTAETPCGPTDVAQHVDIDAMRSKYAQEREKRLRKEGAAQYLELDGDLADLYEVDPYTPVADRAPIDGDIEVAVLGGGFAGLLSGAYLKKAGVQDVRVIDMAGDFGGVWYWNRFPGIQCDNDAYCYIPMLEELDFLPSKKFADGAEIFAHCQAMGKHFDLYDGAIFSTQVETMRWDEKSKRWRLITNRGDDIRARFVVMAQGSYNKPKLPGIPGIKEYLDGGGHAFHSARWDYDYTGGDANGGLDKLADKRVALIGTGATGVQLVPHPRPGCQAALCVPAHPVLGGHARQHANRPGLGDGPAARVAGGAQAQLPQLVTVRRGGLRRTGSGVRLLDRIGPQHGRPDCRQPRSRLAGDRADHGDPGGRGLQDHGAAAEPHGRPGRRTRHRRGTEAVLPLHVQAAVFERDYLPAFNLPNVTLVDVSESKGVERLTEKGIVANGVEYEVDCVVFASGFEITTEISRRFAIDVIEGRDGLSLFDYWHDRYKTLHGMTTRGFPNQFFTGFIQGGVSANTTAMFEQQAEHIAYIIAEAQKRGATTVEPSQEGQDGWVRRSRELAIDNSAFEMSCTPGYYNNEGRGGGEDNGAFLGDFYSPGFYAFDDLIAEWRDKGDLEGLVFR